MVYFTEAPMQSNQQPQNPNQQQMVAQMQSPQQDDLGVNPPEMPPDFTAGGGMDQNDMQNDPNNMMDQDPQMMQGEDPNQQQMDPNADMGKDPNAMGGEIEEDPAAIQGPEDEIKQAEKDAFSDLSPEQMIIKNAELKDQYRTLHAVIVDSIDKINNISHTTYDDSMLDFIVKKLVSMKTMIRDTIVDAFPTRTYVENKIELQRFIIIYNQLANMISEIYKSRIKRQQKIAELNKNDNNIHDPEEFPLFTRGYDVQ